MWIAALLYSLLLVSLLVPVICSERNDTLTSLAPKIDDFKLSLQHLLEGARIHRKRQLDPAASLEQQLRFGSSTQEDIPYLSDYNLTFWVTHWHQSRKYALIGTQQGHLILFGLSDDEKLASTVAISEDQDLLLKAKAFSHHDEQWFAVLESDPLGLHYVRLYQQVGRGLEKRQTISLDGASDMDFVTSKNVHYLAVSTYQSKTAQGYSYEATVKLYHWVETQFDEIASRNVFGAVSITCWVLDGSLYMAVGQETNDEGDFAIGSPVFLYNAKEKNKLVMLEKLPTYGPKKILHFYVSNNHYVIVIGKSEAVIYWWSSGQFLAWQTIKRTAEASDVSVLNLESGEVAIVIALVEEALFYTLDTSGYYVLSFVMSFAGSSLTSLQFMYSGKEFYALALFTGASRRPYSIYKLTLEPFDSRTGLSLDYLQECLHSISEYLDERETELKLINSELSRVWLKGQNQRVTADVNIKGSINSAVTRVKQVLIVVEHKLITDWPRIALIVAEVSSLSETTDEIESSLDDLVLKSTKQDIGGTWYFRDPVSIPSLNIKSTDLDVVVNGVTVSRLSKFALRKYGDQRFLEPVFVDDVNSEILTVNSLNGVPTKDLLLLKGDEKVVGLLKFSNVWGDNFLVNNINSAPVENMVTVSSDQRIVDLKTIHQLNSLVIDVHEQTNGEYLDEIRTKILLTDTDDEIKGKIILNDAKIEGVLFVTRPINNKAILSKLAQDSVLKHTQQELTSPIFFMTSQLIGGDLVVGGFINQVDVKHLMTKGTPQTITGDVTFGENFIIDGDLETDSVNNIDLSEFALLKSPSATLQDQFVMGLKVFVHDVQTDSVNMTEYMTLDGVDPSLLMQDIVKHKEGVIKEDKTTFGNVMVAGNVTVLNGTNGLEVLDMAHLFWLKSKTQEIENGVYSRNLFIENDLESKLVNSLNLDTDVVRSFGNSTIDSGKEFEHTIDVKQYIRNSRGTLINGIDIFSFKTELEREVDEWAVHGIKVLESLEVFGDVSTDKLNDLNSATEIMQPKAFQTLWGDVTFSSEITSVSGPMSVNDLAFDIFNGAYFRHYLDNTVRDLSSRAIKNKVFAHLEGTHLQLSNSSTIGQLNLFEILPRIVTLDTMQLIPSSKIFASGLHFENKVVAVSLNNMDLSSLVHKIVLKDEYKQITSTKQFQRIFKTDFMSVEGSVNNIKIENLEENSFSKSNDNEILSKFTFMGDIDVGHLLASYVDGIDLNDVILTNEDETLGSTWFLHDVETAEDIFVTGYVNGCDLSKIQRNAFYTNKTQQVIREDVTIDRIEVIGDIKVKNGSRHFEIEDLKKNLIFLSEDEMIKADVVMDSEVFINTLNVGKLANGIDLSFIVQDAVRYSVPQVIASYKTFQDDIASATVRSQNIFIRGSLAGVNIDELLEKAVKRKENSFISGKKYFPSVTINIASIEGRLNDLNLSRDIVLTHTTEVIEDRVNFMSDLELESDLYVKGKIDGVVIEDMALNRVSLSTPQKISSRLIFWEDSFVIGNIVVDGTINDVVLEMVTNVNQDHPINGYKYFTWLNAEGSLHSYKVNGYDITMLKNAVLKFNTDESINAVQVFEKQVDVKNSLLSQWINGISLTHLYSLYSSIINGLGAALTYFYDVTSYMQNQLSHQLSIVGKQTSKFAYLILIQELNFGPVKKILHGYNFENQASEFSHSMLMWTSQKQCAYLEKCCTSDFTYWMKARKSGRLVVKNSVDGRLYPIHNPAPVTYDKDFFIWTNATQLQPKWCSKSKGKMHLASITDNDRLEIFFDIPNAPVLSDVKTFRRRTLYAVAAFFYDSEEAEYSSSIVYAFNEVRREWTEHQILPSFGVLSMDITTRSDNEVLLALGTGMDTIPDSYSTVFKWNEAEKKFEVLQNVPSRFVTSTLWIHHDTSLLLALSGVLHWPKQDVDCFESVSGGQIDIFIYEEHLKWIQSIHLGGVVSTVSFTVSGDTFMAAASSQQQIINLYEWKGQAGFGLMQSIPAGEVRHLGIFTINDEIFMTVAKASESSQILKAVTRGKNDPSLDNTKQIQSYQKDTAEEKLPRCL